MFLQVNIGASLRLESGLQTLVATANCALVMFAVVICSRKLQERVKGDMILELLG